VVGRTTEKSEPWARGWDRIFHSNAIHRENRYNPRSVHLQAHVKTERKNRERYYVYGAWWKWPRELLFFLDGKHAYTIRSMVARDGPTYIQMAVGTHDWNPIAEDGGLAEHAT